jgi:RNA polymerase sigma factor for flagellar operon FliA
MERTERERLAKDHLEMVERIALSMRRRFGQAVELEDIRSFAMLGLASAIDNYDTSRGVAFTTYASIRVRGAIYDGLVDSSWFPRRLIRQIAYFRKADEMLAAAADDPPPADAVETAHRLADRLKELATAYVTTQTTPADEARFATHPDVENDIDLRRYSSALNACMTTLTGTQRTLLREYFYEDRPLNEIASDLGYTRSWATRAMRAALEDLRKSFGGPRPSPSR